MSFLISLLLVPVLLALVLGLWLAAKRRWISLAVLVLVIVGGIAYLLHPVCQPITEAEVETFNPPIETREGTGLIGQRYFQQKNGGWYHCKTWIARQFFF